MSSITLHLHLAKLRYFLALLLEKYNVCHMSRFQGITMQDLRDLQKGTKKSFIGNSIYTILFTLTHVLATHQIYTGTLKPQV